MRHNETILGDRYKIVGTLGDGATSEVLKAEDTVLKRSVAIKLPIKGLLRDQPEFTKMFIKEAKYLASLEHPNILPLYDYYESTRGPVLVTRCVEKSLNYYFREPDWSFEHFIRVARQIGATIDFCTDRGIAHRDIKPDNFLVDEFGYVYLTDFGIAAPFEDDQKWNKPVGTPPFVSPEIMFEQKLAWDRNKRKKSDQFSLGVMLYQLLTGHIPFDYPPKTKCPDDWEYCTALRIYNKEEPIQCSERDSSIPYGVDKVVMKMLSLNPNERFPSSTEAVENFLEALEGRSTSDNQVFISFSHQDEERVQSLVEQLRSKGIPVWWSPDIDHGRDWDDQVEDAMLASEIMLVMISPQSVKSNESKNEWKYWIDAIQKPLIPVVLTDCRIPYRLSPLQRVDAVNKLTGALATEILSVIRKIVSRQKREIRVVQKDTNVKTTDADIENLVLKTSVADFQDLIAEDTKVPQNYQLVTDINNYIDKTIIFPNH
jgi:serine/threonine protein kinase